MTEKIIQDIRRKNLNRLVEQYGTQAKLGHALGFRSGGNYISSIMTGMKDLSEKTARKWELALRLPRNWFDMDHGISKDFDFIIDAPSNSDDPNLYTRVVVETNRLIRERGLDINVDKFKRIVDAALKDVTSCRRTPEESVAHILETAFMFAA